MFFALNHLLHFYRGQVPLESYLRLLARCRRSRCATATMLRRAQRCSSSDPCASDARRRRSACVAGSDAHTLRRIGRTWTAAPGRTREEFLASLRAGLGRAGGGTAAPRRRRRRLRRGRALRAQASWRLRTRVTIGRLASGRVRSRHRRVAAVQFLPVAGAAGGQARERQTVAARRPRRSRPGTSHGRAELLAEQRAMSGRVAITGIGLVTALGTTREETWARSRARRVRHSTAYGVRHGRLSQPDCRPKSITTAVAAIHAAAAPALVARRSVSVSSPRRRRSRMRASAGCASTRSRIGVFLGAGTADLMRNERYVETHRSRAGSTARGRRTSGIISPSTPVDVDRRAFRLRRTARVHRRRLRVEHDRDRPGGGRDPRRPRRRGAGRRQRRAGATDLQRVQCAARDGLRSRCRPFDRGRAGMNIGEGAGDAGARGSRRGAAPRRARIYAEIAGHGLDVRGVSSRPRPSRTAAPSRRPCAGRCADAGDRTPTSRSRQRARHGDAAERSRRGARHPPSCSAIGRRGCR